MKTTIPTLTIRTFLMLLILPLCTWAGPAYWQQHVDYKMDIDMDVNTNRFSGTQELVYTNNSPDTLYRAFYHLYFNAFQPGSMMDVRSRTIDDPDARVGARIAYLNAEEMGWLRISELKQDGKNLKHVTAGTILEVDLARPLPPGAKTTFNMRFEGQVPIQIRRSGRDNAEGIRLSMSQWYPKICEYDREGWHANPYVGREFHGVWGDFDVTLRLDASYVVAATGYIQNPEEVGHGYQKEGTKVKHKKKDKLKWHFKAPMVHDFVWAADPNYTHARLKMKDGPELHFFYQKDSSTAANWQQLPEYTAKAFSIMNRRFGKYPYKKYSVIQGGDGGMEYPMATLVTGERSLRSLVGVTVHELIHSWFQCVVATNEALYPWIDEGFTSYATHDITAELFSSALPGRTHMGSYSGYYDLVRSGLQEPMTTHADHYQTNKAYGTNAYSKGTVTLHQLSYVIGQEALDRGLRRFFREWQFKHPTTTDFKRCVEKESGLELDWYFEYWVNTTHTVDYGFGSVLALDDKTRVQVRRIGNMPMPTEVTVFYKDGRKTLYYLPLRIMRGEKKFPEDSGTQVIQLDDWTWVEPEIMLEIPARLSEIRRIELDHSLRMADLDRSNNVIKPDVLLGK